MTFDDRADAGRRLAVALGPLRAESPVVVGLPRGGVPVAFEVARSLQAPLDVILVRKLGVPFQPELAVGAVGESGVGVVNEEVVRFASVTPDELDETERRERHELARQAEFFRTGCPPVPLPGRTVVVVDDGIATGSTARAACEVAKAHGAARVVLAVPVASPRAVRELSGVADRVVCLSAPAGFGAVGQFYADFSPVSDRQVLGLLRRAADAERERARAGGG